MAVTNMLTGKMELDEFYEPGSVILLEYDVVDGQIHNAPFIAAEILNILVGSFSVITAAPFTALVAGLLYRTPRKVMTMW